MAKVYCAPPDEMDATEELATTMNEAGERNLKEEVEKYQRLLRDVPEPNCGRIRELKEAIRKGDYLTKEIIMETAERIAARFLGKE